MMPRERPLGGTGVLPARTRWHPGNAAGPREGSGSDLGRFPLPYVLQNVCGSPVRVRDGYGMSRTDGHGGRHGFPPGRAAGCPGSADTSKLHVGQSGCHACWDTVVTMTRAGGSLKAHSRRARRARSPRDTTGLYGSDLRAYMCTYICKGLAPAPPGESRYSQVHPRESRYIPVNPGECLCNPCTSRGWHSAGGTPVEKFK